MKRIAIVLCAGIATTLSGAALAQTDHDTYHPATPSVEAQQSPAPDGSMGGMPAMQNMPEQCRAMMQQMMKGGMMGRPGADATNATVPDFTKAYLDAMHESMVEGVMADDADVAFVQGMIPHHQGAIDMAKIVQRYGDDPQTKEWADQIIEAQEREIAEMRAWLAAQSGNKAEQPR